VSESFIVTRLLGRTAFGYEPNELVGLSILGILAPVHREAFKHTAQALLAGTPSSAAETHVAPPEVRALLGVLYKSSGPAEVMADSTIKAVPPAKEGVAPTLTIWSRRALDSSCLDKEEGEFSFRVFPSGTTA